MEQVIKVWTCDRCGQRTEEPISVRVHIGYEEGAVSLEPGIKVVDLCESCIGTALQRVCNISNSLLQARSFVEAMLDKTPLRKYELP